MTSLSTWTPMDAERAACLEMIRTMRDMDAAAGKALIVAEGVLEEIATGAYTAADIAANPDAALVRLQSFAEMARAAAKQLGSRCAATVMDKSRIVALTIDHDRLTAHALMAHQPAAPLPDLHSSVSAAALAAGGPVLVVDNSAPTN